jgi:hypothetical protein
MESANKVPFCLTGYDALDIAWVVPVPALTGAITSHRARNLVKLVFFSAKSSIAVYAANVGRHDRSRHVP